MILKNRNVWLGLGTALPLLFHCYHEGLGATLVLLGTMGAGICLVFILGRILQNSRN